MMRYVSGLVVAVSLLMPVAALAQADPSAAIKAVLAKQVVDWNKGDLDAFAKGYKDSPDILFMGNPVSHGYAGMVAKYKKNYSNHDQMGVLSFSELEVQPLDARFATVTGKFHLERTAAGGGNADGYYLLVFEKTAAGWKCIRDSTTPMASPAKKTSK
jgi:ketosteroid isomerase-like protein